jgi:hypothetical protein
MKPSDKYKINNDDRVSFQDDLCDMKGLRDALRKTEEPYFFCV